MTAKTLRRWRRVAVVYGVLSLVQREPETMRALDGVLDWYLSNEN